MEEKYNKATHNRPEGDRPIDAPSVFIDLEDYIEQIKDEKQWEKSDRNAIVVFKSDKLRLVIVALRADAEMTNDHPNNIFSVQVIDGKVTPDANGESTKVKKDQVVVLHENIPYKIVAEKKSVFLLTVVE